jgi:hypothetical protein
MQQIEELSPDELKALRQRIDARVPQTPDDAFDRKLREMGLMSTPRLPRDPSRPINPTPVVVRGKPLSESLIEERR